MTDDAKWRIKPDVRVSCDNLWAWWDLLRCDLKKESTALWHSKQDKGLLLCTCPCASAPRSSTYSIATAVAHSEAPSLPWLVLTLQSTLKAMSLCVIAHIPQT